MKKFVINGITFSQRKTITGIQRVCIELLKRLDSLADDGTVQIEYAYPAGAENKLFPISDFKNILPVELPNKSKIYLESVVLPKYIKKNKAVGLCIEIENGFLSKNHISVFHDLRPLVYSTDRLKLKFQFWVYLKIEKFFSKKILIASDYQKMLVTKHLKRKEEDIYTLYWGWEHIKSIKEDDTILDRYSLIEKGNYYYSLGSLAPHKNFKWIIEVAKRNPDKIFAIAGGKNVNVWKDTVQTDEFPNVIFLGYVSDEENKALMQNCKAFLFPSKFEGFGIPPLEALACGAEIIISNATCLPEIYEDCAHYFDPDDYTVDLEKMLNEPVAAPEKILKKCSWDKVAMQYLDIIKS